VREHPPSKTENYLQGGRKRGREGGREGGGRKGAKISLDLNGTGNEKDSCLACTTLKGHFFQN